MYILHIAFTPYLVIKIIWADLCINRLIAKDLLDVSHSVQSEITWPMTDAALKAQKQTKYLWHLWHKPAWRYISKQFHCTK